VLMCTGCASAALAQNEQSVFLPIINQQELRPSGIVDLTNWKLTLSYDGDDAGSDADEVLQPALRTFEDSIRFYDGRYSILGGFIDFVIPATDSATTEGSDNPRMELREMTDNGQQLASWNSNQGTHILR